MLFRSRELPWDIIIPAAWALNMLLVFGLMGYFLDFERMYFIGLVYAVVLPLDFLLRNAIGTHIKPYMFFIACSLIALVGVVYLVRFLRNYPVLRENA